MQWERGWGAGECVISTSHGRLITLVHTHTLTTSFDVPNTPLTVLNHILLDTCPIPGYFSVFIHTYVMYTYTHDNHFTIYRMAGNIGISNIWRFPPQTGKIMLAEFNFGREGDQL